MAEAIKIIDAQHEPEKVVWGKICDVYKWKKYGYTPTSVGNQDDKRLAVFRAFSSEPFSKNVMDVYKEYDLSEAYTREAGDKTIYHCACSRNNIHSWHFAANRVNGNVLRIGIECRAIVAGEKADDKNLPGFVVSDEEEEYEEDASSKEEDSDSSRVEESEGDPFEFREEGVKGTRSKRKRRVEAASKPPKKSRLTSLYPANGDEEQPQTNGISHKYVLGETYRSLKRNVEHAKELLEAFERSVRASGSSLEELISS